MKYILLFLAFLSTPIFAQNCTDGCGSISGISWLDVDEDGIRDAGEPPVLGVVSLLESGTLNLYTVDLNPDGTYEFPSLKAARYIVEFSAHDRTITSTLSKRGNDPTRDSDPNQGSVAVQIDLAEGEDVTSAADIGWATGGSCRLEFQELRTTSCDDPTADVLIIAEGIGQAEFTVNGNPAGSAINDTFLLNSLEPGFYDITAIFADGCQTFITFNVSAPQPQMRIIQTGSFCTDPDSVDLEILLGNDTDVTGYTWSNGSSAATVEGADYDELYSVTVTFASGCVAEDSLRVDGTIVVLPDTVRLLNCVSGTDTLRLPDDFAAGIQFQLYLTFDPLIVTEYVFDTTTNYYIEPQDQTGCFVEGFGSVENGRLDALRFNQRRPEDCLLEEASIFVTSDAGPLTSDQFNFDFSGPAGGIVANDFEPTFANLFEANVGTYSVDISTNCGDTTLFLDLTIPDTCDFSPNVSGFVRLNDNGTCDASPDVTGVGIPGINVRLSNGPREYFFVTDDDGRWEGLVLTGDYAVTTFSPSDSSLIGCGTRAIVSNSSTLPELISPMVEARDCASLNVDVTSNRFRRCFENRAFVTYNNRGAREAQNAILRVTVDPLFEDVSATAAFTRRGDTITFLLGELSAFASGQIELNFTVSCESDFGQLHCLEANITSTNACDPGDGIALIDVRGAGCAPDSLYFDILNVGSEAMTEDLDYFVYVSGALSQGLSETVPGLGAGEALRLAFASTGETIQVVARQSESAGTVGAPYPSAVIESCGGVMTGNATQISSNNDLLGRATYCRTNTGSFDPNEKLVFPVGLGPDNDVQPGTRLTYELHFQNTGTDTAFTVVIRDTLPVELDLATIEFGPASHDYEVRVDNGRALTFTFNDIDLVDSFTNVLGSMGVVSFTIDHDSALERGDRFQNRAGIFFDFNEPIITEYARTRIAPLALVVSNTPPVQESLLELGLWPNPTANLLHLQAPENISGPGKTVLILDLAGREITRAPYRVGGTDLSVAEISPGTYVAVLVDGSRALARRRFVVGR